MDGMTSTSDPKATNGRTLRVLLADDEPLALQRLETLLASEADVEIVGQAADGEEAGRMIRALAPDLAFLDIAMPGQDGVSLARALGDDVRSGVIFVTAYDDYAAAAFEIDAVDYILKPVSAERLHASLVRARRRLGLSGQARADADAPELHAAADATAEEPGYLTSLWVQKRHGLAKIDISSIDWIEAARDYVLLHTDTRTHIFRATMDTLGQRLDPAMMIRVSRSAFVRRDAVKGVERQGRSLILILADDVAVRAGTTFIKKVEAQFGWKALKSAD